MKFLKYSFIILIFIATQTILHGNDCNNTFKKCKSPDQTYKISSSSRSIKLTRGKKARVVLNAYGGRAYYFSLYARSKVGLLQFRIINSQNNQIIYDNSTEALVDNKTIKLESTQKLFIEVVAPNWKSDKNYECAGFKVAYKKI